jgi:glycosyltransferase
VVAENFIDDSVQAVYGNLKYVNKNNTKVIRNWKSSKFIKSNLYKGWMPPHPTLFIRKNMIFPKYMYNETLSISSDYEMILRLFLNLTLRKRLLCLLKKNISKINQFN